MATISSRSDTANFCTHCEVQFKEILELLENLNETIQKDDDIANIVSDTLKVLSRHRQFVRGSVTIFDRKNSKIVTKESFGLSSEEQSRGIYTLGEGITGEVVETGKSILVSNISEDSRFLNRTGARRNMSRESAAFICVPVKSVREVIGTLSVERVTTDRAELERDLQFLQVTASMISQAVRLYRAHYEEHQQLISENLRLTEALNGGSRPGNIIGETTNMRGLYSMVRRVAATNATVLILGESGVGKELVARAIHDASNRNNSPFVTLNCAALPENIIESELFGHEKGAFTGAVSERKGRFELADRGTIFLDEIGELGLNMQAKLLRVLQEREFERVGGVKTLHTDVRVLAATNRDLEEEVKAGKFREDLYYRLNIIPLTVPPLRERKADILPLVNHFIEKTNRRNGLDIKRISTPAIDMLMAYHWPGNVRELENCIERAAILSEDGVIHGQHLPPTLQVASPVHREGVIEGSLQQRLDAVEYELLVDGLKATKGNLSKAAEMLGLTNRQIGIRMRKYGLSFREFRGY